MSPCLSLFQGKMDFILNIETSKEIVVMSFKVLQILGFNSSKINT